MAESNYENVREALIAQDLKGGDEISFTVRNPRPETNQCRGELIGLMCGQRGDFILLSVIQEIPLAEIDLDTLKKPKDKPSGYVKPDHL